MRNIEHYAEHFYYNWYDLELDLPLNDEGDHVGTMITLHSINFVSKSDRVD